MFVRDEQSSLTSTLHDRERVGALEAELVSSRSTAARLQAESATRAAELAAVQSQLGSGRQEAVQEGESLRGRVADLEAALAARDRALKEQRDLGAAAAEALAALKEKVAAEAASARSGDELRLEQVTCCRPCLAL